MKPKEYLLEITKYRRLAQSTADQIDDLRNQIGGLSAIAYDRDRVQTSPSNRMEQLIPKLIRLEEKYARNLARYNTEVLKRTKQIEGLDNPLHVSILTMRYVRDMKWEEIAEETTYTFRHVTRVHGEALQAFGRLYNMS